MTQDAIQDGDERLTGLLRQAAPAPAPRDAMFRIAILERRERGRFRRRILLTAVAGIVASGVAFAGLVAGDELRTAASVALVTLAAATASMTVAPALTRPFRFARI
jgi:hypothetical protein